MKVQDVELHGDRCVELSLCRAVGLPNYSYEPRLKTSDDTQLVHKYYFPTNIEEDIETFFNENTLNMYY